MDDDRQRPVSTRRCRPPGGRDVRLGGDLRGRRSWPGSWARSARLSAWPRSSREGSPAFLPFARPARPRRCPSRGRAGSGWRSVPSPSCPCGSSAGSSSSGMAQLLTLLPHNYGDLPLHWTYVQHLASGASFWPENPILTQDRLRYPLGVDLLTAVFVQLGARLRDRSPRDGPRGGRARGARASALGRGLRGGGLPVRRGPRRPAAARQAAAWWTWTRRSRGRTCSWRCSCRSAASCSPCPPASCCSDELACGAAARRARAIPGVGQRASLWGALPLVHLHTFAFVSVMGGVWAIASRPVARGPAEPRRRTAPGHLGRGCR